MASGFSFHIFFQMRFLWSFHIKLNLQLSQIRPTPLTHGEMPLLVFLTRFSVLLAGFPDRFSANFTRKLHKKLNFDSLSLSLSLTVTRSPF